MSGESDTAQSLLRLRQSTAPMSIAAVETYWEALRNTQWQKATVAIHMHGIMAEHLDTPEEDAFCSPADALARLD